MYTGFGAITLWTYYSLFLQNKGDGVLRFLCWIPYLAWQCFWSYLAGIGIETPDLLNTFITLTMLIGVVTGGYDGSIKKKTVFAVSYLLLTVISESIVWYGVQFFCAPDVNVTAWWPPVLARVLLFLAIVLLYLILRRKNLVEADERANRSLLFLSLGNTFVAYSVFMAYDRLGGYADKLIATLTVLVLFLETIFVYQIYGNLWENMELKRQNEGYRHQMELYLQQQRAQKENEEELRRYRHDLRHKLVYLKELADVSRSEEISRFLKEEFSETQNTLCPIINTGNLVVDAMLNNRCGSAVKDGVRFETQLDIPSQLPFLDNDLCVILGNLLENAYDAASAVTQREKYVAVKIWFDRGNLILIVENSFDGELDRAKDGSLLSSKKDKKNHNFGIKSVKKYVKKCGGDVYLEDKSGLFKVKVVLYG